jgi:hypothetical protein
MAIPLLCMIAQIHLNNSSMASVGQRDVTPFRLGIHATILHDEDILFA